jgi:SAM-dependent methyltransferase
VQWFSAIKMDGKAVKSCKNCVKTDPQQLFPAIPAAPDPPLHGYGLTNTVARLYLLKIEFKYQNMDYANHWQERTYCIACGSSSLELVFEVPAFPIFNACTSAPKAQDIQADMIFDICKTCGCVQLRHLAPLSIVYGEAHSDGPGDLWANHYAQFASFISQRAEGLALEVGGGKGRVAQLCIANGHFDEWLILEPSVQSRTFGDKRIQLAEGWLDENLDLGKKFDLIVFSHSLEHMYNPIEALRAIYANLKHNGKLIVSFPDLKYYIKNGIFTSINFEHTFYADSHFLEYLAFKAGFKLVSSQFYCDHSIFYHFEPAEDFVDDTVTFPSQYIENKSLLEDYGSLIKNDVDSILGKLQYCKGPIYISPANVLSQMLLFNGIDESLLAGVVDNSTKRIGKRLYGTSLMTFHPEILRGQHSPSIIIRAGGYTPEIKKQIVNEINSNASFL